MKAACIFIIVLLAACGNNEQQTTTVVPIDSAAGSITTTAPEAPAKPKDSLAADESKTYANKRFKDVTVQKTGDHVFLIQGKAQVFEAAFSWVVEDGSNELKKGFEMTDAGAPEWGAFKFGVDVKKEKENSTLTLVLFEASAKDGSRQDELPIVLY